MHRQNANPILKRRTAFRFGLSCRASACPRLRELTAARTQVSTVSTLLQSTGLCDYIVSMYIASFFPLSIKIYWYDRRGSNCTYSFYKHY